VALARAAVKLHVKALRADSNQALRKELKERAALDEMKKALARQHARYADVVNAAEDRHDLNQYRIEEAQGRVK